MRKIILVFMVIMVVLSSCGQKSAIQQATKATAEQGREIENSFEQQDIEYETIKSSNDSILEGMGEGWEAYDITDRSGNKYILILQTSDKSLTAILDADYRLVNGILDNGVLPKWYELEYDKQ